MRSLTFKNRLGIMGKHYETNWTREKIFEVGLAQKYKGAYVRYKEI